MASALSIERRRFVGVAVATFVGVQVQSCLQGGTPEAVPDVAYVQPSREGTTASGTDPKVEVVSIVQSLKVQAADITQQDIGSMVSDAVALAGGFDFIRDGQTVVLKPNLLITSINAMALDAAANGITTDWRVTRAVAELVREKNPTGKVLVMEGSTENTTEAYSKLGYTMANFGTLVDEFIALEGASCSDPSATGLVQKIASSGKPYWVNERFVNADVVISIAVLKTHMHAGITGSVKNIGIGTTPANKYAQNSCSRTQTPEYIDHGREGLAKFIHDYYSLRPADFALVDGLQGMQNGPAPHWFGGNYNNDRMNMRLILAGKNAVAVDSVQAAVMGCDPKKVEYLVSLARSGLGTTDLANIHVVGNPVGDVQREFAGPDWACGSP